MRRDDDASPAADGGRRWRRYVFYRTECIKTTWAFRLATLAFVVLLVVSTRGFWVPSLGRSLMCTGEVAAGDVILVENFDPYYLLFERAETLQKSGLSQRVVVPTDAAGHDPAVPGMVSQGIVELMARVARLRNVQIVPIQQIEPISLNVAYQLRDFFVKERLGSVIVVTQAFRSRRSYLIYHAVLEPAGIRVYCLPVLGGTTPENWTATWHGIQDVIQQFMKLQFYRLYVLPRFARQT